MTPDVHRTTIVVDASVAIKWVVGEPDAHLATPLLGFQCVAPDLIVPECVNILWKKVIRSELSLDEATLAGRLLLKKDIDVLPMSALMEMTLQMAVGLGHPAYDCTYLALASRLACHFVTADRRLFNKLRASDPSAKVLRLDDAMQTLAPSRQS